MSLHDSIGTDKEGNEITLIDILGSNADDIVKEVDLKIEKSKIYRNLDILDDREKEVVVGRFGRTPAGKSGRSGRLPRIWGSRGVMYLLNLISFKMSSHHFSL